MEATTSLGEVCDLVAADGFSQLEAISDLTMAYQYGSMTIVAADGIGCSWMLVSDEFWTEWASFDLRALSASAYPTDAAPPADWDCSNSRCSYETVSAEWWYELDVSVVGLTDAAGQRQLAERFSLIVEDILDGVSAPPVVQKTALECSALSAAIDLQESRWGFSAFTSAEPYESAPWNQITPVAWELSGATKCHGQDPADTLNASSFFGFTLYPGSIAAYEVCENQTEWSALEMPAVLSAAVGPWISQSQESCATDGYSAAEFGTPLLPGEAQVLPLEWTSARLDAAGATLAAVFAAGGDPQT
ncbi:hypothetical protein GCM10009808_02540 [Microbacterium sediminicola]|uniref:Uncharacterized protein n=1 Tax=Microbacterium sediminicola TaxID=415210 RepID=A0ABP4TKU7_9MICO